MFFRCRPLKDLSGAIKPTGESVVAGQASLRSVTDQRPMRSSHSFAMSSTTQANEGSSTRRSALLRVFVKVL